jgi:voltage-gated potassium channel
VAVLTITTFAVDLLAEFVSSRKFMLVRTLRPGPVTVYRVIGGIAGYLLIVFTCTFAYLLLVQLIPGAIRFDSGIAETSSLQPGLLTYFNFITLSTVGYGDVHPVHPAVRSLAVAEALVGQLYIATLIASLVGMASQARSERDREVIGMRD